MFSSSEFFEYLLILYEKEVDMMLINSIFKTIMIVVKFSHRVAYNLKGKYIIPERVCGHLVFVGWQFYDHFYRRFLYFDGSR